jgi:hypothetical protein
MPMSRQCQCLDSGKGLVKTRKLLAICKYVVTRLLWNRYQDVFALLVPSCCDKSGTSCYHLITRLMTVTDLLQIVSTRLIQAVRNKLLRACCHQLVTCRRYQTCWNNLLRICRPRQPCYKMITTCSRLVNNWEQAVRTHLLDNLWDFYAYTSNASLQYSLHSSAFWMMVFKAHFSPFNWKN